jgi:MFS family permease
MKAAQGFSALRQPAFRYYAAANALSLLGSRMQRFTMGWIAWEITQSGMWLGLIAFSEFIAIVLVLPVAGGLVDRFGAVPVILVAQAVAIVQVGTAALLFVTGNLNGANLCLLTLALGISNALFVPADMMVVGKVVSRAEYVSAISLNSTMSNTIVFVGPLLTAVLVPTFGISFVFFTNAASFIAYLVVVGYVLGFKFSPPANGNRENPKAFWKTLFDGAEFVRSDVWIAYGILLCLVVSIGARALAQLMPAFAGQAIESGPTALAWCTASLGLGASLGALWVGHSAQQNSLFGHLRFFVAVTAATLFVLTFVHSLWAAIPLLMLLGFTLGVNSSATQSLIQLHVPENIRGKVLALFSMAMRAGPALGALVWGAALSVFGLQMMLYLSAAFCLICWLAVKRRIAATGDVAGS